MLKAISFLGSIIILLSLVVCPAAGLAQSLDQRLVLDDAGIFGNRISEVESAAAALVSQGADVRVRTISTYGAAPNLDQYEAQLEQRSPSWLDPDGGLKNTLIVLIISLQERQTGLYYGAYWENAIGNNWLRIQTDVMNPLFRSGDYAGGAVKGLQEIQRLIGKTPAPTGTPAAAGAGRWWIVPLVILVLAGSIIGLVMLSLYRKSRARRLAARQKAMLAKQGAASGINELVETVQMLEIKVNVTADRVAPEEAAPLREGLGGAKGLVDRSAQAYSELSHSAGDPENPRLGEAELSALEPEYGKILDNLRQARELINGVEAQIAAVQQTADGFPGKVAEVNAAIQQAGNQQDELKKAGFNTDYPAGLLAQGQAMLQQAQDLVAKKRFAEAAKYAGLAGDQIKQAVVAGEELPQKKQEAEAAIPALASRIERVKQTIENSEAVFDRVFHEYAETTWESVRGNGTEAENRVNWALEAQDAARVAAGMGQQEWHKALDLVKKGNTWLTEAESLVNAISELEANLIAARRDATKEIDAAQADVTKARDYIAEYDADIRESLETDLRAAADKNERAREELKKEKPDYFQVCRLAREANEEADKILIQARSEHEAAERLRAKAASTWRDAQAKVSIASRYVENHHPVVQGDARRYLNTAVEALRQVDLTDDPNSRISLALNAEQAADQAYTLAQRDVQSTSRSIPNVSMPTILFPPAGHAPSGAPPWGSRRTTSPGFPSAPGRTGGGSTSWGSRGGMSGGGGGGRRGGGSSGW